MLPFLVFLWILLAAVTAAPDNRGTEFILGFPPSRNSDESAYINITTAELFAVTVRVTAPGFPDANLNETFTVKQGEVKTVTISSQLRVIEDGPYYWESKAVRITSTAEVIVYVSDGIGYQNFLAYPIDGLGKEYYLVTCYAGCTCHFVITGIIDNTFIDVEHFGNNGDYNVSLNNITDRSAGILWRYDIQLKSGTGPFFMRINATEDIAVFSRISTTKGIYHAKENADSTPISEQALPAETWGKTFMVPSYQSTSDMSFIIGFFSVYESTFTVNWFLRSEELNSPGGWIYKLWTYKTATIYVDTSAPGHLVIFYRYNTTTASFAYNYPFVTVPPMELFPSDYQFNVHVQEPLSSSLVLLAQQKHYTGLKIDGLFLPDGRTCQEIYFKDQLYQECQIQIAQGLHHVNHESPNIAFGCMVYGSTADDIYLNFCGTRLTTINKECTVSKTVNGDGLDNDCDGAIDEEICNNGIDEDNDGRVDEDCAVTCATLTTPIGGNVTLSTIGSSTQANFTCNTGYTLEGEAVITCDGQGTWSAGQPTCVHCPDLADPSSGLVTMKTNGTVSTASFTCSSGYYVSGATTLSCRTDATWNNSPPVCKCNLPKVPADGEVLVSDSSSGTIATYTCNTGHSISGKPKRTCLADGRGWEATDPSCTVCDTVTPPSAGALSIASNGTTTSAIFTCDVGGSLKGTMTLVCQPSGTYDNEAPTCVSCPSLSDPTSGSVTMTTDGSMTTATFSCESGYYLSPRGVLICTTSGSWDAQVPSCTMFLPGQSFVVPDEIYIDGEHTVTLQCQFSIYGAHGFVYKIRWYSNNNLVVESPFLNSSEAATYFITDNDFAEANQDLFDINIEIYCTADVFVMRDDVISGDSLAQSTPEMFNPLKIDLSLVNGVKGKESVIPVTINIPFGCSETSEACALQLKLFDPKDSLARGKMSIAVKGTGTCGIEIRKSRLRRSTAFLPLVTNIVITSVNDISYSYAWYAELKLETNVIGSAKPFWRRQFKNVVPVNIAEIGFRQGQYCYSHVDPHMRSFDGRYFENQYLDEFVMYVNEHLKIRIHMITVPCNRNTATCSCAVAMKFYKTLYIINHCNSVHNTGYQYGSVKNTGLWVTTMPGNRYKIDFRSDLQVRVLTMFSWGASTMNIDIYPGTGDAGKVEGLCGNFDGIPGNDNMSPAYIEQETDAPSFPLSWGLKHTDELSRSLFNIHPSQQSGQENDDLVYCVCPNEETGGCGDAICKASKRFDFDNDVSANNVPFVVKPWINPNVEQRKRRKRREVPSNNTLTYDEARSMCESSFQGCPVYSHQTELSGIDTEPYIHECALDVQIFGDVEWATAHCEALSDYFVHRLDTDEVFSDGLDQAIVTEVLSKICPGNCSGHGFCLNGSCICDEGYGTDSCVIDLNKPPVLYEIAPGGICDITSGQTCDTIFVTGDGFIEEPQCSVQIQQGDTTGYFNPVETTDTECLKIDFNEIAVNLTKTKQRYSASSNGIVTAYRYGFSISNNRVTFSDFQYVTVIDGTCQEAVVDGSGITYIRLKDDFCYIDGVCYSTGTTNSCERCEPSVLQYTWTNVCNEDEDSKDPTNRLAIGIGAAGAVGMVFIVVSVIVGIRIMRKPKRIVSATPTRPNANRMLQTGERHSTLHFMFESKALAREHSQVSVTN